MLAARWARAYRGRTLTLRGWALTRPPPTHTVTAGAHSSPRAALAAATVAAANLAAAARAADARAADARAAPTPSLAAASVCVRFYRRKLVCVTQKCKNFPARASRRSHKDYIFLEARGEKNGEL